jgi:hypothetical protein
MVSGVPPKTTGFKHVGVCVIIDGLGTGSIIVDPSFVERRLQSSSKNSVKVHFLTVYRTGLLGVRESAFEFQRKNQIPHSRSDRIYSSEDVQNLTSTIYLAETPPEEGDDASSDFARTRSVMNVEAEGNYERRMANEMSAAREFKDRSMLGRIRGYMGMSEEVTPTDQPHEDSGSFDASGNQGNIKLTVL